MDDLEKQAQVLYDAVKQAAGQLHVEDLEAELSSLVGATEAPDFWSDNLYAQATTKKIATLRLRLEPWQNLMHESKDLSEMAGLQDESLKNELVAQLSSLQLRFDAAKNDLKLSGPYDDHDAVLSIFAGAGGTDAQDWAGMLLRMYVRYAEKAGCSVQMLDESSGDEAGLKSALLTVNGPYAYGKLKGEHGVHRLVRLSPFNADSLRQTSFAKVDVLPKIEKSDDIEIDEKELKIDVYRSGGKGGQGVNTTDSAVRITHIPTGITVAIQNERSQLQNRETAMGIIRSKLAQLRLEQHKERISELKGPNEQAAWGNQIRSYVLHPYKMVKDLRTNQETSDTEGVLGGDIEPFITAYLEANLGK